MVRSLFLKEGLGSPTRDYLANAVLGWLASGMIQHHTGALIMVQELMDVPGSAQDSQLYDFAVDIENTQTAEINIMKGMLQKEKK